jgi:hypothetical protein
MKTKMRLFGQTLIWLIPSILLHSCVSKVPTSTTDYRGETDALLEQLVPVVRYEGNVTRREDASIQTQEDVQKHLIQIANQSSESRSQVIQSLMEVIEDPQTKKEAIIAHRWTVAVHVLGKQQKQ